MSKPIPQPPESFLVGNLFAFDGTIVGVGSLFELYGPIIRLNILGRKLVFVGCQDVVNELCNEKDFGKWLPPALVEVRSATKDGLFTAYEDEPVSAR